MYPVFSRDVPARVVSKFEVEVTEKLQKDSAGIVSHDLTIPAVSEYVVRFAQKYKISLLTGCGKLRFRLASAKKTRLASSSVVVC
jgi:hypothetical protein